jgi:hypothetical protein
MFVDVCFPRENEEKYIEIAKKLGTGGLLFVYNEKSKIRVLGVSSAIKLYYGVMDKGQARTFSIQPSGKRIIIYDQEDRTPVTQVHAKEAAAGGKLIMFPSSSMNPANREWFKRASLMFRLCKKYKIPAAVSSYARSPYTLTAKSELYSMSVVSGMDEIQAKAAIGGIYDYLESDPSAIFL